MIKMKGNVMHIDGKDLEFVKRYGKKHKMTIKQVIEKALINSMTNFQYLKYKRSCNERGIKWTTKSSKRK
jgi:hypothetical protein